MIELCECGRKAVYWLDGKPVCSECADNKDKGEMKNGP